MFNFNIKKTAILRAVKWEKFPLLKFAAPLSRLFFYLLVLSLFLLVFSFGFQNFSQRLLLGLSILFLVAAFFFWQVALFFDTELKTPEVKISLREALSNPAKYNLAEFVDFETVKCFWQAIKFCKKRKIASISSTIILYFLLRESPTTEELFLRLGLNPNDFQERVKNYIEKDKQKERGDDKFTKEFREMIIEAAKVADERKHNFIGVREVLVGISRHDPFFKEFLVKSDDLTEEDIENITRWSDYLERRKKERKKFWEYKNLLKHGSLGRDWASGYTITLDQFSTDWRDVVKQWTFKEIIGHGKEIEKIERVLTRSTINNVLLVGQPGTGRKSIVEALAHKIHRGESLQELNHKRVVELDLVSLLSQIQDPEKVEATLDRVFNEVITAGNVILVINEFHKYISLKSFQPGAVDISGIVARYLQYPQFPLIAITTYAGLHRNIEQNPSLLELFEKIEVSEISALETIRVLENLTLGLEVRYRIFVTYPAVRAIVRLTERYMPSAPFPKKAIDLLEEVIAYVASQRGEKVVLPEHVEKVLSEKTEIPIGKVGFQEKETLLNLEELIHKRIINQDEAVKEISTALRRARANLTSQKRPMGVFLFLGPTGVGKTETSKALAEIYFKGEENMIRLDMSEFQEISDIERLIGAPGQEGLLTTPVRESPFSLVLLDEIEKAHPNILNLFLQVFDEGHITDGQGRKTSFTNTIIICTSNAGAEIIWKDVELDKKLSIVKNDLLGYFFEKALFRPEFINRFDAVVIFTPLTKENLLDIAGLMLGSLKKNLKEKGIEFEITKDLKEKIVDLSYNPAFGAREMRRVIQDKVGNVLAQALLGDKIKRGDKIKIDAEKFNLKVDKT